MPMDIQTAIQCTVEGVEQSAPCHGKWAADEKGNSLSADGQGRLGAFNYGHQVVYTCIEGSVAYGAYLLGYSHTQASEALELLMTQTFDSHNMELFELNDKHGRDMALSFIRGLG